MCISGVHLYDIPFFNWCHFPCMHVVYKKKIQWNPLNYCYPAAVWDISNRNNTKRNSKFFLSFPVQMKRYFYIWSAQTFCSQDTGRSQLLTPETSSLSPINWDYIKREHPHVRSPCAYESIIIRESGRTCIAGFV